MSALLPTPLMGHLVIGYPSLKESLATALAYAAGGITVLELQVPFSHPTADGPLITEANRAALAGGATWQDCLQWLAELHRQLPHHPKVVMTYANKALAYGPEALAEALTVRGVQHLILPDYPWHVPLSGWDSPAGPWRIPVIAPNISPERLSVLQALRPAQVYLTGGYRLTGQAFGLDERVAPLATQLHGGGISTWVGFGISSAAHVQQVLSAAQGAVLGSALLKAQAQGTLPQLLAEVAAVQPALG